MAGWDLWRGGDESGYDMTRSARYHHYSLLPQAPFRRGGVWIRLLVVLVVAVVIGGGLFVAHRYQRRNAIRQAHSAGLEAYQQHQYSIAARELGRYLAAVGDDEKVRLLYADALLQQRPQSEGTVGMAINAYEEILRRHAGHEEASDRLSRLYLLVDSPIEAERVARSWKEAQPENGEAWHRFITALRAQNKPDKTREAVAAARARVQSHPRDALSLLSYAEALLQQDDVNEAVAALESGMLDERGHLMPSAVEDEHGLEAAIRLAGLYAAYLHRERTTEAGNADPDDRVEGDRIVREVQDASLAEALAKAEKLLEQLTEVRSDSFAPFLAKARFHLEYRWPGPAFAESADRRPTQTQPAYWPQLVQENLTRAAECDVEEMTPLLELGRMWLLVGDTEQARGQFTRAAEMAPHRPEPYAFWARTLLQLGLLDEVDDVADQAMAADLGEMRIDLLIPAVEMYYAADRPGEAEKCINELKRHNSPTAVLNYVEGLKASHEGDAQKAIQKFSEAITLDSRDVGSRLRLARIARSAGDLKLAEDSYQEYLRRESSPVGRIRPQIELARLLSDQGRHPEAIALIDRTVPRTPPVLLSEAILARIEIQVVAAEAGDMVASSSDMAARTSRDAERLRHLMPDDPAVRSLAARSLALQNRLDEAATLLNDPALEEEQQLAAKVLLADLYARNGHLLEALETYRQAADMAGEDARRRTLQFRMARLHNTLNQNERCSDLLEEIVVEADPSADPDVFMEAASLLMAIDDDGRAGDLLNEVVQQHPDRVEAWLMLFSLPASVQQRYGRDEIINRVRQIEGPDGAQWRLLEARSLLQTDRWRQERREIEQLLHTCLEIRPEWIDALLTLAELREKTGHQSRALELYRRAWKAGGGKSELVARKAIPIAFGQESWVDLRQFLSILPAHDPALNRFRIHLEARTNPAMAELMLNDMIQEDHDDWRSRLLLAELKRRQGDRQEADRLLAEAAEIAPAEPEILRARVAPLIDRHDMDQIIALCTEAIEQQPIPEAYALRASAYSARGDLDKAQADLEVVAATPGWEERGYHGLGQFFLKHGMTEEAVRSWRLGLEKSPGSLTLGMAIAEVRLRGEQHQQQEGMAFLNELMSEFPANEELKLLKARFLEETDPRQAEAIYQVLWNENPDMATPVKRMALLAARQGNRDEALRYLRQGLELAPQDVDLLLLQSDLYARDEPLLARAAANQAAEAAGAVLARQPDNEAAAISRARALTRADRPADAIQALREFLNKREAKPAVQAQLELMRLYFRSGRLSEAEEALPELKQAAPDDPRVVKAEMELHAARGRWDELEALAETHSAEEPGQTEVMLGVVDYLLGAPEESLRDNALAYARKLAEEHPDDAQVLNLLGRAEYQLGHYDRAEAAFRKGLDADPGHVDLANNLAWILCEVRHRPDEAQVLISSLIDSARADPAYPHLLDTWGTIQMRLGRLEAAAEAYQRCREDTRTAPATRAAATVRLARALAPNHSARSRRLLEDLKAKATDWDLLSAEAQREAEQLLEELRNPS